MQIWFNGLCNGALIALLATAYMTVYLPTGVFYIALAGVYVLSPYIALQCMSLGLHWSLAVLIAIIVGIIVSVLCDLLNHRPLEKRKSSSGAHMISSLGIYMILVQLVALIWGNDPRVLKTGIGQVYRPGGIIIAQSQLVVLVGVIIVLALFFIWLRRSRIGLEFRGLADNPIQMALLGYNTDRLRMIAFAISGGLGATAGLMSAYDLGFDPHVGMSAVLLAIVATIIGGKNRFTGPVIGGLLLGIIRSQVVWHASARWQDAITFLLLAVFLFLKPNGILGEKERLEAAES